MVDSLFKTLFIKNLNDLGGTRVDNTILAGFLFKSEKYILKMEEFQVVGTLLGSPNHVGSTRTAFLLKEIPIKGFNWQEGGPPGVARFTFSRSEKKILQI